MENKEALGFAAKAASVDLGFLSDGTPYDRNICSPWNPSEKNDDCLRLAVNLEMDIQQDTNQVLVWYWIGGSDAGCITEDVDGDRLLATRKAVFSAAVEIGKSM